MITVLILLAIVIVFALWAVGIYNGLVTARNAYKNAFDQIDVQLQRRFDLIPNLVETAKGYLEHERGTLEAVTAARQAAPAEIRRASWRARACTYVSITVGAASFKIINKSSTH